ncbi:MAG: hypothetical protein J5608_02275 [Alphaproteobacteria bacterium]|nr:hypothetical protein [Alphaproteobacteria bacterium]
MNKIPFFISNLVACFVPNSRRRSRVRGRVNLALFRPWVKSFVRRAYGVEPHSVEFVRQITLNRMSCVVNDNYFVKIFRNVRRQRLDDLKFLLDFIRPYISVEISTIQVHKSIPMYVSPRIPGRLIYDFDKETVLKNENKILKQVAKIIQELQSIDLKTIPNVERFSWGLQPERTVEKPCTPHPVLAHFDLNEKNFLFDDDLNIVGLIDWDSLSIAQNPSTDMDIFMKYWDACKNRFDVRKARMGSSKK